jgi:pyruvate/2-oxoglutarate dehydrogenase complex dihydrolipoamide acyltransferase (E2) component
MLQFVIRAPRDGQVEMINCHVGENIAKNAVIVKFVKGGKDGQNAV